MNSSAALLATLALILPAGGSDGAAREALAPQTEAQDEAGGLPALGLRPAAADPLRALEEARRPPPARQVRIEQRVIIRVGPSAPDPRLPLVAEQARRASSQQFVEQRFDDCVPIGGIVGVQPASDNRLLLFMRDRTLLTASLERSCNAADFYSGFYVERSGDGELCQRRDRLQSRAGASCQVAQFNRLVAADR